MYTPYGKQSGQRISPRFVKTSKKRILEQCLAKIALAAKSAESRRGGGSSCAAHFKHTIHPRNPMASFSIKAALAAASSLQSTNQAMSANLRDLLAGESEDGWSDEEEEEEEDFGPRERESRKRPDYSSSAWGKRLANLESLRMAGRLVPSSREAKAFRSDFRVPYEFFLHFVDLVRTIFPTATRDVAGRQCVPLELKVGALDVGDRLESAAVWPFRSPPCMYVGSVDV